MNYYKSSGQTSKETRNEWSVLPKLKYLLTVIETWRAKFQFRFLLKTLNCIRLMNLDMKGFLY